MLASYLYTVGMYTAECVTPHHPDKLCDRISDAMVDVALRADPYARCAIEVQGGHGIISVTGETSHVFTDSEIGQMTQRITGKQYQVRVNLAIQSPEIARGVDTGGAGDQGIMVGYATRETPEGLPLEYALSRRLAEFLYASYPVDGKTQVTVTGIGQGSTPALHTVLASFQDATREELMTGMRAFLQSIQADIRVTVPEQVTLLANPCGDWGIGGFDADAGCTGRKIVVDAYGPRIPVGGGAFSGKDPTKVDRSAAYAARQAALRALADHSELFSAKVMLAYAIGMELPVQATLFGYDEQGREILVNELTAAEFTPGAIIRRLDLHRPLYEETSSFGHFGRPVFPWEVA